MFSKREKKDNWGKVDTEGQRAEGGIERYNKVGGTGLYQWYGTDYDEVIVQVSI